MPLSEIYLDMLKKRRDAATPIAAAGAAVQAKVTNKLFDDVFSQSENEFEELQWDKGQLVVSRKSLAGCSPKSNDGVNAGEQGVVPWIQYPITDDLQATTNETLIPPVVDDCVDLLNQLTGFDNHQDSNHAHNCRAAPVLFGRSQHDSGTGKSTDLHLCENSHPSTMSKIADRSKGQDMKTLDFMDTRPQNRKLDSIQNPQPPSNCGLLNFSHFLRPAMLANNANPQGACKLKTNETTITASNVVESKAMECPNAFKSIEMDSRTESASYNVVCQDDALTTRKKFDGCSSKVADSSPGSTVGASSVPRAFDTGKKPETVITSSSKCSANRADAASSDPKDRQKRKISREGRHCAYDSEDEEGDSEDTKEPASARRVSTKRKRASEVHNLSERRRRDRINEKMHELQDLIPHCNKVDKVSMLEQAIEYLKMLKMQVQMMSMGSGMYMAPMMFSPAMQSPQMPPFSPMPMGMGFGMGMFNSNVSPMVSIPTMHGPQFRGNFVAGPGGIPIMHGSASQQIDGTTGLRMPVLVPRPTTFPLFPGHSAMPNMPQIPNSEPLTDNHKKNRKEESPNKRNPNN